MGAEFSIDLISDLHLDKSDNFNWSGKPTSLFLAIAGGISDDLRIVKRTLEHLSTLYRGVFYIDGSFEHLDLGDFDNRITDIADVCRKVPNVIYLHNHVVVLNGIAFTGINGWYNNGANIISAEDLHIVESHRQNDLTYLGLTIKNFQLHRDISKIVVISNCIPSQSIVYHNFVDEAVRYGVPEPGLALLMDTDHKVSHWLYGGSELLVDSVYNSRRYVNNPKLVGQPYWPKRIVI